MTSTDQAADQTAADQTATEPAEEQPKKESTNAEAAKYRTKLREAEAERDGLRSALDTYRRRDVERAAESAGMARGADLFDAGQVLDGLLADDGTVDADKVAAAAAAVLADRPHWAATRPRPKPDLAQGQRMGKEQSTSMQKVLSGGRRE